MTAPFGLDALMALVGEYGLAERAAEAVLGAGDVQHRAGGRQVTAAREAVRSALAELVDSPAARVRAWRAERHRDAVERRVIAGIMNAPRAETAAVLARYTGLATRDVHVCLAVLGTVGYVLSEHVPGRAERVHELTESGARYAAARHNLGG